MDRKGFVRALAVLPVGALVAGGAKVGAADHDVPFTHTAENQDRLFDVDHGAFLWSCKVFDAATGTEHPLVAGGNWDAPWLDVYDGRERHRVHRPFVIRFTDGRTYRSAS